MSWYQMRALVALQEVDALLDLLTTLGAQATTQQNAGEESYYDLAHPAEPKWDHQAVSGIFDGSEIPAAQLSATVRGRAPFARSFTIDDLDEQDWANCWQDQYQALKISDKLWICPSWEDSAQHKGQVVKIDPGMAFGTGTHETTRLCLQLLCGLDMGGQQVLDYGCGSGILAISALKLGAAQAVGVDIDPKAQIVSMENAVNNGVQARFNIQSARDIRNKRYDVIVANILAGALCELATDFNHLLADDGVLILSGILAHQADAVKAAYHGACVFSSHLEGDWLALMGRRR